MTLLLWPEPDPPPEPKRWPRCDDCGRRIWSPAALRPRHGRHLGSHCYRKRVGNRQRLVIRIAYTPPGDIPGQTELTELEDS